MDRRRAAGAIRQGSSDLADGCLSALARRLVAAQIPTMAGIGSLRRPTWAVALVSLLWFTACSPSPSAEGSSSPSPSDSSAPSALPTETPVAEPELGVRLTQGLYPPALASILSVEIMSDGQVVQGISPDDPSVPLRPGGHPWTTRSLTAAGLDQVDQEILSAPLLQASGDYRAQLDPSVDPVDIPIGIVHSTWMFTVGGGSDPIVVTSDAWLGDEVEAMYWVPSPERMELDRLARLLASVSDWIAAEDWTSADWVPYEAESYLLWVTAWAEPLDGLPSVVGATWPFDGPIEEFGDVVATTPNFSTDRCGYLDSVQATDVADTLSDAGVDPGNPNPDVMTDGGRVTLYLSPRTVDGFPTCADLEPFLSHEVR
jgi:hypothetical protein